MKRCLAILALLFSAHFVNAQAGVFMADKVTGNLYRPNSHFDVEGSRFFLDDWSPGIIFMSDGYRAEKFKLKLDLESNELLFLHEGQPLVVVNPVKEFVLTPVAGGDSFLFRKGFDSYDKNNGETYYQVLQDGEVVLLKHTLKYISERKEYNKAATIKEYTTVTSYFIAKKDGSIVKVKREKSSLLAAIGDSSGKLLLWSDKKKNRARTEKEMIELVRAYNEKNYE